MEPTKTLYSEYLRLIEAASLRGLTDASGLTPREHEQRLAAVLPPDDLRRLRELLEISAYHRLGDGTDEAHSLCRELADSVRAMPLPPKDPAPRRRLAGRRVKRGVLFVALALGLAGIVSLIARRPDSRSSGGGHVKGVTDLTTDSERREVDGARGDWSRPEHDPSFTTAEVPSVIGPTRGIGFDTMTGIDHDFVDWRDPVDPPLGAHHRTDVYTSIDEDYRFGRGDVPLRDATARPGEPGAVYEVDVRVRLPRGRAVPIPSPAPGSRVLEHEVSHPVNVRFVNDGGQGLRAISDWTGVYRLRYRVAARRGYETAPLPNTPMRELEFLTMPLPENVRADAEEVLAAIGGLPAETYAGTVRRLHAYFSGFGISSVRPSERRGSDYLTVALARKGVCRHRATAFVITANAAGIPARLVTNEIHAFAEVQLPDGTWRLIELRVLDSPRAYAEIGRTGRDTGWFAEMMALFAVAIFVCLLLWRDRDRAAEHLLGATGIRTRSDRRAERDRALYRQDRLMERLLDSTVYGLCERFGVPPEELDDAIEESAMPVAVRSRALNLLKFRPEHARDPYSLREAYWDAKAVLSWVEGGAGGERT